MVKLTVEVMMRAMKLIAVSIVFNYYCTTVGRLLIILNWQINQLCRLVSD